MIWQEEWLIEVLWLIEWMNKNEKRMNEVEWSFLLKWNEMIWKNKIDMKENWLNDMTRIISLIIFKKSVWLLFNGFLIKSLNGYNIFLNKKNKTKIKTTKYQKSFE